MSNNKNMQKKTSNKAKVKDVPMNNGMIPQNEPVPVLILKWWQNGVTKYENYRETEFTMGEMDLAMNWAKELDIKGWRPVLYSKTWDGKFTPYFGVFYTEKSNNKRNSKPYRHKPRAA